MPRKNLKKPYFLIALALVLSPAVLFGFSSLFFLDQFNLYLSFNDDLNYNNYIGEFKEPDYALLELRSCQIENAIQEFHTPNGTVLPATFTDKNLDAVDYWHGQGDSDIWTGCYIAGEAFRWAVADRNGDIENRTKAEIAIMRAINQFEHNLLVTGIPGALARYAVQGTQANFELGLWEEDWSEIEGGSYDGWRYITYISRDQLNGVSFGYGTVYSLVNNQTIREKIAQHTEWIIDYFEEDRWLAINEDGTNSIRFAPYEPMMYRTFSGSNHLLAWLNLGRLVDFEKYDPIYRRWAIDKNLAFLTDEDLTANVLFAYYSINVVTLSFYGLMNLETDPTLKQMYINSYIRSVYDVVKYHRNTFQNFIYMSMTGMDRDSPDANLIIKDSLDSLQRYAESHYPTIKNEVYNTWYSDYEDIVDPISVEMATKVETNFFLRTNPITSHTSFEIHSKYALPVNRRGGGSFIWQDSPFKLDYGNSNEKIAYGGVDYTLAYWMGRYFYYIPDGEGVFN